MERIKKLWKTKTVKIGVAATCIAAILAMAFFLQPGPKKDAQYDTPGSWASENKPEAKLLNTESGVEVNALPGVLPEGVKVTVIPVESGDSYTMVQETLKTAASKFKLYDISLMWKNTVITPNGTVSVSIPVPQDYDGTTCKIYSIDGTGMKTEFKAQFENGRLTFETTHFSLYAVVQLSEEYLAAREEVPAYSDAATGPAASAAQDDSAASGGSDISASTPTQASAKTASGMIIDPATGKDKYKTDPVPDGKPIPVEPEDVTIDKNIKHTATLSIRCDTILNNMNLFNQDKLGVLPQDGTILLPTTVTFYENESVFDVLKRVTREQRIQMEFVFTPMYNSVYVEGIHNLYEFDTGSLSGWMYKVNGWFPNYGASRYVLKQGDVIEWVYTCDLGKDVGGYYAVGGGS